MRILLDNCLDWWMDRFFPEHLVRHVGKIGWAEAQNGVLLMLAQEQFDVLVTSDKKMRFQQNVSRFRSAVVVLDVMSNRIEHCELKIPSLLKVLPSLTPGTVTVL